MCSNSLSNLRKTGADYAKSVACSGCRVRHPNRCVNGKYKQMLPYWLRARTKIDIDWDNRLSLKLYKYMVGALTAALATGQQSMAVALCAQWTTRVARAAPPLPNKCRVVPHRQRKGLPRSRNAALAKVDMASPRATSLRHSPALQQLG